MLRLKLILARTLRVLSRSLARSGGTTLPGRVLLRLEPRSIGALGARLKRGSVLVSATNGKTTTASMLAGVLARSGAEVVHNRAGSNMNWGVATALLDAGRAPEQIGLFEVDEAWLAPVARELDPSLVLLSNLFRDQLDRYGELELLADRWAELVAERDGRTTFVLNADDPLVADLGRERRRIIYFGVEDPNHTLESLEHASDSKRCRNCGAEYIYEAVFLGHLGHYRCPSCGRERPKPQVAAEKVTLHGMSGSDVRIATPAGPIELSLPLPGLYNVYNALAATAAALELGATPVQIRGALAEFAAAFGRVERLSIGSRELAILLVKNPAGANEVLRILPAGDTTMMFALNDRIADGRDISWVWDVDWEIIAPRLRHVVTSGTRAADAALRLKYAGVDAGAIEVVPDIAQALDRLAELSAGGSGYVLPTYTAMLELQRVVASRGLARPYWEEAAA
jgi:lipid II isoglutaminyl synthase (glutamine-hydrolysing)